MFKCPSTNRIIMEAEDIKIGEIYKHGKENFLILSIEERDNKIKTYTQKDIETYGEYRTVQTVYCICKKTTELDSRKQYMIVPGKFSYKHTQDKFNKILYLTETEMKEIGDTLEEKDETFIFEKDVEFDNGFTLNLSLKDAKLRLELLNENGDSISEKNLKSIDFDQKVTLKNNKEMYSMILLENDLNLDVNPTKIIKEENKEVSKDLNKKTYCSTSLEM